MARNKRYNTCTFAPASRHSLKLCTESMKPKEGSFHKFAVINGNFTQLVIGRGPNFRTKIQGKVCKPVCIFRQKGHTIKTNLTTFSTNFFGPGVTKINCSNYKRNMKMKQNMVCLFYRSENLYQVNKLIPLKTLGSLANKIVQTSWRHIYSSRKFRIIWTKM